MSFFELKINNTASFVFDWYPRFTEDSVNVCIKYDYKKPILVASDSLYDAIVPNGLHVIDYVLNSSEVSFDVPDNGMGYLFYQEMKNIFQGVEVESGYDLEKYHLFTTPCCDGSQETWIYPHNGMIILEVSSKTYFFKNYRLLYRTFLSKSVLIQWRKQIEQFTRLV